MTMSNILSLVPLLLTVYMIPSCSLLLKLTTLDSFFISINFIISFLNRELEEIDIININSSVYERSALDRYILYCILQCIYSIGSIFLWIHSFPLLSNVLLIFAIPIITNYVLKSYAYRIIAKKKEYFIKKMIAKYLSRLITSFSKIYLNKDNVYVGYKKLMPLLDDYQQTISYTYDIIKTSFVLFLLARIKKYSPWLHSFTKRVYKHQTGHMAKSYNEYDAKCKLIAMINDEKWDELLKPDTQKAIIKLYYANDQGVNIIDELLQKFKYKVLKISALYVMSSFFKCLYIIPVGSVCFLMYRDKICLNSIYRLVGPLFSIFCIIFGSSLNEYLLVTLISEILYSTCFNPLMLNAYKSIYKKIRKMVIKTYYNNKKDNMFVLVTLICMIIMPYFINSSIILMFGINMINQLLINQNFDRSIVTLILYGTTYLSNFNEFHIIFNTLVIYFLIPILRKLLKILNNYIIRYFLPNEDNDELLNFDDKPYRVVKSEPIISPVPLDDIFDDNKLLKENRSQFLEKITVKKENIQPKIVIFENYMDDL